MNRVVEYAKDSLEENELYEKWGFGHDGASLICRMLFEEATDVNFYVGRAVNPAHQNPDLPINFNIKMNLVKDLAECLEKMGKYLLNSRGIECKWQPTDNTKPVPMIKKRLAGNQTIIAYLRKVKAFDSYIVKPALTAKTLGKTFKTSCKIRLDNL